MKTITGWMSGDRSKWNPGWIRTSAVCTLVIWALITAGGIGDLQSSFSFGEVLVLAAMVISALLAFLCKLKWYGFAGLLQKNGALTESEQASFEKWAAAGFSFFAVPASATLVMYMAFTYRRSFNGYSFFS